MKQTIQRLKQENEDAKKSINQKNAQLKEKNAPIHKIEEEIAVLKNKLNEKILKQAFAYFEKKSDPAAVIVIESLIGILREEEKASALSVELYMKKFEGLMIGLNRLDTKRINQQYCERYQRELNDAKAKEVLTANKDLRSFLPFYDLLEKYIELASHMREEVVIEEFIELKESQIVNNNKTIEAYEAIVLTIEQNDPTSELTINVKQNQLKILQEQERKLGELLTTSQNDLQNFETNFLADL